MEELIKWKEEYTVFNKEIDSQHKELLNVLNIVKVSINNHVEENGLNIATQRLLEYTIYHFDEEMKILKVVGFPEIKDHLKEHNFFIQEISKFKKEFDIKKPLLSIEIVKFLTEWITHHILQEDKKYAIFISEQGN